MIDFDLKHCENVPKLIEQYIITIMKALHIHYNIKPQFNELNPVSWTK